MRKSIYIVIVLVIVVVYLFATDFRILKSAIGYNVPKVDIPEGISADYLTVDDGFTVSKYATGLDKPRVIAFDPSGRMLVSETKAGRVLRLEDTDGDGVIDKKIVILEGRDNPHGLAFHRDDFGATYLYVAETTEIVRFVYDDEKGEIVSTVGENMANLPDGGKHFTRTIVFGPNLRTESILGGPGAKQQGLDSITLSPNKFYVSVGSSCDVCIEQGTWKYASIIESDPEGRFTAHFAPGLRNAVFFAFHPLTGEMWATEMGRDGLGDDLPPDEINIVKPDEHYGWPYCYGDNIKDRDFDPSRNMNENANPGIVVDEGITECQTTIPSHYDILAHSAPLGLAFVTPESWPTEMRNDLLVAYHGSWNRSEPAGYKVVLMDIDDNGQITGERDFLTGFLSEDGETITGRPVDLKFDQNGILYITDDAGGAIYKVQISSQ